MTYPRDGELIHLREEMETAIEASPACLNGISLQMVMSIEIDDPDLSVSLGEIGSHYVRRSDSQFQTAAETIAGWQPDPLALRYRPRRRRENRQIGRIVI